MKAKLKRLVVWWLGWAFILFGILGLFLPILQGILFLLVGLYLLSTQSPWAARLLSKIKDRFPRLHKKFEEAKVKAIEMQRRVFKRRARQPEGSDES
ncbi:MAG TPA: PGPGW domain-containing protein [Blastocatellia bacterium]|nr:PGPGW domain-containing protein [Blastocatellia bacterium]